MYYYSTEQQSTRNNGHGDRAEHHTDARRTDDRGAERVKGFPHGGGECGS